MRCAVSTARIRPRSGRCGERSCDLRTWALVRHASARERRGRTLRAVTLSARLVSGGGWREHVVFRQALCDRERISLALSARLVLLPAPAAALGLEVERFGPQAGEQRALLAEGRSLRAA